MRVKRAIRSYSETCMVCFFYLFIFSVWVLGCSLQNFSNYPMLLYLVMLWAFVSFTFVTTGSIKHSKLFCCVFSDLEFFGQGLFKCYCMSLKNSSQLWLPLFLPPFPISFFPSFELIFLFTLYCVYRLYRILLTSL